MFPSNFVEFLSDDDSSSSASAPAAIAPPAHEEVFPCRLCCALTAQSEIVGKKPAGVGFGNIFQGGMPTLKKGLL